MQFEREFFYDEVRDGFYIPGMMKRLWGAELTILSEVDRICRKHEIPYYADGGTLLGAVRDGQFIPWDDDIDIMMLREDYNRFIHFAQKELPKELILTATDVDKDYVGLAAIVEKVKVGFDSELLKKYHEYPYSGVIDIFILDEITEDSEEEEEWKKNLRMLGSFLAISKNEEKSETIFHKLKQVESIVGIHFDRKRALKPQICRIMDKLFQRFNGQGMRQVSILQFYIPLSTCIYPRSAFDKTEWISFHGMQLPVPEGYDAVLRSEYADYHKKVKGGPGHEYPFLKIPEKQFIEYVEGKWDPYYHFSEEDLHRPHIQNFRDIALLLEEHLMELQKQIHEDYKSGCIQSCLSALVTAQEEAIALGNAIEQKKGAGTESVSILEQYCEIVYQTHQIMNELDNSQKTKPEKEVEWKLKEAESCLQRLDSSLRKELKKKIVFLPHTVRHFESLRPLVDILLKEEDKECKIIPIPYYDRGGDKSLKELHYEGREFPTEYEITDYKNYNFAEELPDCVVINTPYDEFNLTWTVDPFFYSKEMKKYTNKLVYIPWFVTDEINPQDEEDGKAFINMEHYVTVPGLFHSDLTIVQSEGMKKAYLAKIEEFAGKDVAKKMEKKIAGAGSCLLGEKEGQGIQNVVDCFRSFLLKA